MAGRDLQLRLFRDALSTPWGFRLVGGKDVHAPLIVQRVAIGSPVEGELQRGDVILEIQSQNATGMTHRQAQEAIRNAGGSLSLRIRRPAGGPPQTDTLVIPHAYEYLPTHRGNMLGRLQETLSGVVAQQPTGISGYGSNSMSNLYHSATPPPAQFVNPYPTWTRSAPRERPPTITNLSDPGWTPQCLINKPGRRPQTAASTASVRFGPSPTFYGSVEHPEVPAWVGSLRSAAASKLADSLGSESYGDNNGYQQNAGSASVVTLPNNAQHLQYNSPLGLYSKSSLQQAVTNSQFNSTGFSESAVAPTSDNSDVYRMVQEGDRRLPRQETSNAGGRLNPPQSSDPGSIRQSPSLRLLDSQLVNAGPDRNDAVGGGHGITDF